ncbi:hypothetical protein HPP92_001653 [Vanilla planifolia]|uniref:Uncharacterized protein n=1 Tax=Vanilla planifolia TaxID=51239 RepID=A0A835S3S1_VANPL|nr:hypothetical protein HPP92_001653 [Vanilla planifolia]
MIMTFLYRVPVPKTNRIVLAASEFSSGRRLAIQHGKGEYNNSANGLLVASGEYQRQSLSSKAWREIRLEGRNRHCS